MIRNSKFNKPGVMRKSLNEYKLSKIEIIFNDKNDLKYEIENIKMKLINMDLKIPH